MPPPADPCPECHGTRHLRGEGGVYRRCGCVLARVRTIELEARGVAPALARLPTEKLLAASLFRGHADALRFDRPSLVWVRGREFSAARAASLAWAVSAARDEGRNGRVASVESLIDARFDRDVKAVWSQDMASLPVLCLTLDGVGSHKLLPDVLSQAYAVRSGVMGTTVFASAEDVPSMPMKYGPEVAAAFGKSRSVLRLGGSR